MSARQKWVVEPAREGPGDEASNARASCALAKMVYAECRLPSIARGGRSSTGSARMLVCMRSWEWATELITHSMRCRFATASRLLDTSHPERWS